MIMFAIVLSISIIRFIYRYNLHDLILNKKLKTGDEIHFEIDLLEYTF